MDQACAAGRNRRRGLGQGLIVSLLSGAAIAMCSDTMLERASTASKLTWFDTDKCFIDGRWVAPQSGAEPAGRRPVARDRDRRNRARDSRRYRCGGRGGRARASWATGAVSRRPSAGGCSRSSPNWSTRGSTISRASRRSTSASRLKQGRADALAIARYMEFYAGAADKVMGETIPYLDGYTVYTLREPHGVTGHIVPWNYPMQIAGRTVGAALAMGNACVLKPAEEACLTSLALADLAREAGFPAGALNVVPGLGEEAGAALAAHPGVRHLSFTGSVAVGALVQAAAARHVAPVTLELGGKSPQARVRRRRPRARAAVPGQRRHPECRPDLFGRLAHSGRAPALRRGRRADGGALSQPCRSARRTPTSTLGRSSPRGRRRS